MNLPTRARQPDVPRPDDVLRSLNRGSQIVLAVLALLLVALSTIMLQTMIYQRDTREHAAHEADAMMSVRLMLEAMLDTETGERGFLIAGDPRFLEPLRDAGGRYRRARAQAARLIERSSYPNEAHSLAALDRAVAAKNAIVRQNIALERGGKHKEAIAEARNVAGKQAMDAVRAELSRLERVVARQRDDALHRVSAVEMRLMPLLVLTALVIATLIVLAVLIERRHAYTLALQQQADALRGANERSELIARELNHRVKNLFAVVMAIVSLTGRRRGADRETMDELRARIHALSLAHAASQGLATAEKVDLGEIIKNVLGPYATPGDGRLRVTGGAILLPARMVTPLGMIIHELATNAAKYGAFSRPDGGITLSWARRPADQGEEICIDWIESAGKALMSDEGKNSGGGFGSIMIDLAAQQLAGTIDRDWNGPGLRIILRFPFSDSLAEEGS